MRDNPENGDLVMFRAPSTQWTEPHPYLYGIITACYERKNLKSPGRRYRYDIHCTSGITMFKQRKNRIIILAKAKQ